METLIGEGMFTLGKKIGSGAFGTIYEGKTHQNVKQILGMWREGQKKVAIKMEPKRSNNLKHEYKMLIEMQDLRKN
jgi:serine/threonine protein kinase